MKTLSYSLCSQDLRIPSLRFGLPRTASRSEQGPLLFLSLSLSLVLTLATTAPAADITRFTPEGADTPEAVRVKRGDLAHTGMLSGLDTGSGDFGFGDFVGQLNAVARAHKTTLASVAKLNLYLSGDGPALRAAVAKGIRRTWPAHARPTLTLIPSRLPGGKTRIAGDAVIALDSSSNRVTLFKRSTAILPAKRDILYLSGRAASGELDEATAGTMIQLFEVLEHLEASPADVVQVKAFIKPISGWKTVKREIEKSFGKRAAPPILYVEWTSGSRATEIELIAAAPSAAKANDSVTYFTPPGDKASPVFSRVARVHGDKVIYIGGLTGTGAETPEEEVSTLYAELERISKAAGTDLRHFAKAVYYVSDNEVSAALNVLRPKYYDPKRPPAASKIAVPSIGIRKRGLLIDMIAGPSGE